MYYYLYDTFLQDRKYEKVVDRIKTRLLDLDIQGKHERLSVLKNSDTLIADEIKRGAKTIIVLGNDKTFLKAVDVVARLGATIGIIPIGPDNYLAEKLGIPMEDAACESVAARKIAEFDLGQVNNWHFFSSLKIQKNIDRVAISHQGYKIIPKSVCSEVAVYNMFIPTNELPSEILKKVNPQDGKLDLVIKSEVAEKGWKKYVQKVVGQKIDTIIQGVNFEIKSFEYLPLILDGFRVVKTPVSVRLAETKLRVIVGKTADIIIK